MNGQVMIFFVTNFIEYAPAGYEVRVFRYILKRDTRQAMEELAHGQEYLRLQSRDEEVSIPLEQIRYLEVMDAKNVLEGSIRLNGLCVAAVLALSAGAGFFVGLSVIRSRRRELALLRSMGTPNASIFVGFVLENLSCIAIGAMLGGAGGRWQPAGQLALFVGIYAVSLMVSWLIFMNGNLLAAIREEE